jgi:hypothetical protein
MVNRETYEEKVEDLLKDTNTYIELNNDPTKKLVTKCKKIIEKLIDDGCVEKSIKTKLWNENAQPPRIYILLKLHKTGTPVIVIVR